MLVTLDSDTEFLIALVSLYPLKLMKCSEELRNQCILVFRINIHDAHASSVTFTDVRTDDCLCIPCGNAGDYFGGFSVDGFVSEVSVVVGSFEEN